MNTLTAQLSIILLLFLITIASLWIFGFRPPIEKTDSWYSKLGVKIKAQEKDVTATKIYQPTHRFREVKSVINESLKDTFFVEASVNGNVSNRYFIKQVPESGLVVGKEPDCTNGIKVKGNAYIGRKHAIIKKTASGIELIDNDSKNGLYDKHKNRVSKVTVSDGDIFYLAKPETEVVLRFSSESVEDTILSSNKNPYYEEL